MKSESLWSAHLLLPVTFSYALGIGLYRTFNLPVIHSFIPVSALVSFCLIFYIRRHRLLSFVFFIVAFLIFGVTAADRASEPALSPNHIVHQINSYRDAVIIGTLGAKVSKTADVSKAYIDVSFIRTDVNGPLRSAEGRVLLTLKGNWPESIKPGDAVIIRATLKPPKVINTPGTFNYREYLARKSIFLTGTINHPILIKPVQKIDVSLKKNIFYRIELLRTNISAFINVNLPKRLGSIYEALIIGDRSEIPPETLEIFKRSGTMHLLAVSGMHTGLIAALFYFVINWLLRRSEYLMLHTNVRKASLLITLPVLIFYALLTGANPPVVRSLIMITVFAAAFSIDRFQNPLTALTGTAFLILLFQPIALFSPSFQLSFVAVGSILLLIPKFFSLSGISISSMYDQHGVMRVIWFFLAIGVVTIAATIGTFPLMLFHFNRISLVTLPANLLIQPIICFWSLPIGIMSIICSCFSYEIASMLLKTGALGIQKALEIGEILSRHESTQLWLPDPSITICMLYYIGLFFLIIDLPKRIIIPSSASLIVISVFMIHIPSFDVQITRRNSGAVSVLDVGHGSANVIEMTNGHTVLVDGGAKNAPGYDCGERIIAPFLWHRRIGHVDDIIITHDDADHYNGIPTIIERFRPDRLFIPHVDFPKKGLQEIISCARKHDVDILIPDHDTLITQDSEELLIFLADNQDSAKGPSGQALSEDDRGLVLKFVSGTFSMLFPGDITRKKEAELTDRLEHIESTVILSPHHGSSSSNSYPFLKTVNPDYLIFSANDHGSGLFPSSVALKHAELLHIKTHTTSVDGTVLITLGQTGYRIDTFSRIKQQFYRES